METRYSVIPGLLLCLSLSACGGGGGGGGSSGGGGGSGGVKFSINPTSVSADYFRNESVPPEMNTTATATGNLPNDFFIGAVDEGTSIEPSIVVAVTGQQAVFHIRPKNQLPVGTHTGRLRLQACSTQSCSKQIGNSPLYLPYTIKVRQDLDVTPTQDQYTGVSGTDISIPLTVTLPEGATSYETQTLSQNDVCSVADVTATSLRYVMRSLPSGDYFCTLRITASVPTGTRVVQRVTKFTFTPPPGGDRNLSATPDVISLATTEGGKSDPANVVVTPASWDSRYSYNIDYGSGPTNWVEVTPNTGGYSVVLSAVSLPAGTYSAHMVVRSAPPAASADILLALTVGAGLVRPADRNLVVSSDTTAAQLAGSVGIDFYEGGPAPFNATSDASWLTLPVSSGQTGGSLTFNFDNAAFRALPNGRTHTANVTVSSYSTISPVTFKVTVDKRIGEVSGIGPYLLTAGQPLRFYVRGIGLSLPASIGSRLQLDGITGASIATVNDTTLLVTAGAQVSGNHVISMSNALGLAMPHSTVKIIDPVINEYRAIPTGEIPGAILFDAERQTLFWAARGANPTVHALRRAGADWTTLPVGVATADAFGITHDGTSVLAGGGGTMTFLDPQTLALQQTVSLGYSHDGIITQNAQIPVTNDGLIWYRAPDVINSSFIGRYDPRTGERGAAAAPVYFYPGLLPWFHVTRDGETFNAWHQHGAGVLHSSDREAGFSMAGGQRVYSASDDGSRALVEGQQLWAPTGFIGNVGSTVNTADNSRSSIQAVVSPDGRRIYSLSYDRQDYFNESNPLPPPRSTPRIHVLDATPGVQQPLDLLPVVGSFAIDAFPTCRNADQCGLYTVATISPDGKTLFFVGNQYLVIVPIPDESTLQAKTQRQSYVIGPDGARMYQWRLH